MAPIKVYGSPISTNTQRALVTLYEKDVEYELVHVNLATGEHKKEPFISLNPFGQVPAAEHGDLKLFESRAITQYINDENADKGTNLFCPGKVAETRVWMEVEAHHFDPSASKLNWEVFYKPLFHMTTDEAAVAEHEASLAKVLDVYEARLAQSKYLACDCFTMADLHHLPNLHLLLITPSKKLIESRPHVSKWAADITARPSWAKVLDLQKHH